MCTYSEVFVSIIKWQGCWTAVPRSIVVIMQTLKSAYSVEACWSWILLKKSCISITFCRLRMSPQRTINREEENLERTFLPKNLGVDPSNIHLMFDNWKAEKGLTYSLSLLSVRSALHKSETMNCWLQVINEESTVDANTGWECW